MEGFQSTFFLHYNKCRNLFHLNCLHIHGHSIRTKQSACFSGILTHYFIFAPHLGQTGRSLFAWKPQLLQMQEGRRLMPPK